MILAIDFETFYDKDYSLRCLSTWNYVHHPRFDAYLVSAYGDDGKVQYVGHPSKFDWSLIKGATLLMHNAGFDELVLKRLRADGIVPADCVEKECVCTADLSAYLDCRRNLKQAAEYLLGVTVDKTMRDRMKGKTAEVAEAAGLQNELHAYALSDAKLTYDLFIRHGDQWPESERELSRLNREAGYYGIMVDRPRAEASLASLQQSLFNLANELPWVDEGEKPLSPKAIRAHGRKVGIPVPGSLAKTDPMVEEWRRTYQDQYPWVRAISEYRSVNTLLKKVKSLCDGLRADDTFPYQTKYYGAHTGRLSGGGDSGGKFNIQNLPQQEMFDVDLRPLFIARPGHTFIVADYRQIEARVLLWLAGEQEFLTFVTAEGGNIYQAYARKTGRYTGSGSFKDDDPKGYRYVKAAVLGLGFRMGAGRFLDYANNPINNLGLTPQEAEAAVTEYRANNPRVVRHWASHQTWLQVSANHKDAMHEVVLRSGRVLRYFEPRYRKLNDQYEIYATYVRGDPPRKLHSGILTENEVQATARDIMCDAWRALAAAGYRVLWTVHDEIVVEVPLETVVAAEADVERLMTTSSPWAAGCPIAVESHVQDRYSK